MERLLSFDDEHEMFRDSFRSFVDKEMVPIMKEIIGRSLGL